jgi:glycosyltransferase involved in cell wall biosynthesis
LIREFVRIHDALPSARFVLAGDGYLRSDLERLVAELGVELHLPARSNLDEELRDLYRSAWVLTSMSKREGWGMSIPRGGRLRHAERRHRYRRASRRRAKRSLGILVPDGESLTREVVEIVTNDDYRLELSRGARAFADTLSWDHVALRLFQLLDESARKL